MYESNGPDVKIRGTASHVAEKYLQLARDAQSSGDPIAAENYYQHAEHYFRLIAAAQEQFRQSQPLFPAAAGRDARQSPPTTGYDDGDDDEQPLIGGEPFAPREPQPFYPREQQQPQPQPQPHRSRSTAAAAAALSAAPAAHAADQRRGRGPAAVVHHRRPAAAAAAAATGPGAKAERLERLRRPGRPLSAASPAPAASRPARPHHAGDGDGPAPHGPRPIDD